MEPDEARTNRTQLFGNGFFYGRRLRTNQMAEVSIELITLVADYSRS
jgi:hypothetical protein